MPHLHTEKFCRSLDFDETNEPKKLRSKVSLKEISLTDLEQQFVPPNFDLDLYDNNETNGDEEFTSFVVQTYFGDFPEKVVEEEKETGEENTEMDDPDYDPMGEDLKNLLDEHEYKFNRSTKISQKEADLLLQVYNFEK